MEIPKEVTLNHGWAKVEEALLPTTKEDETKLFMLRQQWWFGAAYMLKVVLDAAELAEDIVDQEDLLNAWNAEIQNNVRTELLKFGISGDTMETLLHEEYQNLRSKM